MSDPVQLDMLPLVETATEPDRPQRKLNPGTCALCGLSAWDRYKYSDDEFSSCYVAHHDGGRQCQQVTHRHPERHNVAGYLICREVSK